MTTIYTMRRSEVNDVENVLSCAIRAALANLHSEQCKAVHCENHTPAARVAMVLQLAKLSTSIERAGYTQLRRDFQEPSDAN